MFDLANDRLHYGELLQPDMGYTLDFAVGTTYSLDLEALLGVPVSFGLLESEDCAQMDNPLYILEAIRSSADHIALFCNAGGIKLPSRIQSVYSLLEESVFEVRLSNHGNFHPKLWVLKYTNEEGDSYIKLLVLSRNLTFDTSIDLCVALRGAVQREPQLKNRPLADMLTFVSRFAKKGKKEQILEMADDVLHIAAFEVEAPFEDYEFYPMGIPGYDGKGIGLLDKKRDLFVVSPFLSDDILHDVAQCSGRRTLVTRRASVTDQALNMFDQVYITKDVLSDNEFTTHQDIHTKLYFTVTDHGNDLYIGSANASHNAFYRNVECLLRLRYRPYAMGHQTFFQDFIPEANCPYEEITYVPELPVQDSAQLRIEDALREAVYALKKARVQTCGTQYATEVRAKSLKTAETVWIAPLQRPDLECRFVENMSFRCLLLKELSEFYILRVQDRRLVVKIETSGIPRNRDQAIYRNVIDTRSKFFAYLSFTLSDDGGTAEMMESKMLEELQHGQEHQSPAQLPTAAVYEKMLRIFHQNPARLKGIADMIQKLDPNVVGEEFLQMYQEFEHAVRRVKK